MILFHENSQVCAPTQTSTGNVDNNLKHAWGMC